ncbi:MAG: amidohydrolase family protein [Rhodobacteraceae bacterium]|nr:amidohydrolase family protein [Paracoccaceae bacterium]
MGDKRLHGREEEILDPDLPIIDAHHHLFDFPHYRYLLDDYLEDARAGLRIVGSVYIEIQAFARKTGPEVLRPLGEVEFANGVGAMCAGGQYGPRVAAAQVAYADMRRGAEVGIFLDRALAAAPGRLRGLHQVTIESRDETVHRYITHRPPEGVLDHPGFDAAMAELGKRGLLFDAAILHHQIPDLVRAARRHPDVPIVLSHMGLATGLGRADPREVFDEWRGLIGQIADCPSVTCKIGGFGLPFWGFGFDEAEGPVGSEALAQVWKPYVETAIEVFGADRCMMESNYPQDSRSCGFVPLWNALKRCVAGAGEADKRALFAGTAARVYGLDALLPTAL